MKTLVIMTKYKDFDDKDKGAGKSSDSSQGSQGSWEHVNKMGDEACLLRCIARRIFGSPGKNAIFCRNAITGPGIGPLAYMIPLQD